MTEAQYKNWKRVQKSGLAHYLIWHISLWGGIPAGIIFAILDFLYSTDDHKDKIMRFFSKFLIVVIVWTLIDIIQRYLKWKKLEEEFQKRIDENQS